MNYKEIQVNDRKVKQTLLINIMQITMKLDATWEDL